jgi:hypothetical protein
LLLKRISPQDKVRLDDHIDIAIPTGYVADELPDPVSLDTDFASYHSAVTADASASSNKVPFTSRGYLSHSPEEARELEAWIRSFRSTADMHMVRKSESLRSGSLRATGVLLAAMAAHRWAGRAFIRATSLSLADCRR